MCFQVDYDIMDGLNDGGINPKTNSEVALTSIINSDRLTVIRTLPRMPIVMMI